MITKHMGAALLSAMLTLAGYSAQAQSDRAEMSTVDATEAFKYAALPVEGGAPDDTASTGPVLAVANAANYQFTTNTTSSLFDMSSGTTTLIPADSDDVASLVVPIGFDFYFQGVRQDRFSVNSNGSLRFGATPISNTLYEPLAQAGQSLITAYGADQRTRAGTGKVHYRMSGTAPNRRLVVEWLNMQSDFNAGGTADLTYQVHINEQLGIIDFFYGSMSLSTAGAADPNSSSPQIGFSSNSTVGNVGSITAAQSGTPAPTFSGASATPATNTYVAGAIPALTSATNGSRRTFSLRPSAVTPPTGPLTFTGVTAVSTTMNWGDSPNESAYAIYVSTDGISYTFINSVAENATTFTATGLLGGTTYQWRVYAVNEGHIAFLGGTQATATPTPNASLGSGLWSNPGTWSTGIVPTSSDAVTIATGHTVTIDTAALAYSVNVNGVLQFEQTTARTLTVGTDTTVNSGGTLQSNAAGTQSTHNLSVGGNLVNNGALDFSTNADTAGAIITFTGTNNSSFSGSGAVTDIRQITVNKGISTAATLELLPANFTVRGATTDTSGWLVLTNGTLKLSGTFPGTNRVFSAATYTVPATGGFWLNNANYIVAGQNGNAINNGLLRITQGAFNQGTTAAATFGAGAGAVFTIEGGTVNLAGRFNPASAIVYNQSAGDFNVAVVGNSGSGTGNGSFVIAAGSTFNMSGGTITLVQASTGATPVDYINSTTALVATSGVVRAGSGATVTNFNFRIRGNLPNFVVDNTTNAKTATATAQVNFNGTTTISTGSTFVTNGQVCLIIGPTFTNNGTLNGTAAASRFYFLGNVGPTTYNGTGTVTAPLTAWEVDNRFGVTIDPAVAPITALRVNLFAGGVTNANRLSIGNGGTTTAVVQLGVAGVTNTVTGFDVAPTFNLGSGGLNLLYAPELTGRTSGPEMPPSRTLNLLSVTNTNPITIAGGDVEVNGVAAGALALGSSRIITGANTLFFNSTAGTVTRNTGYVEGNFRKSYAAAGSKTFEVGTANGYTPVVFDATAGTFPTNVSVAAVQSIAPGIQPAGKAITRYWDLNASGITANVTFSYLDPADLPGTLTEANLHVYRHEPPGPANYTDQGGTLNTTANTIQVNGITQFSEWTLAEFGTDLAITKTDGVTTADAGGSVTYTITASNNGPGANPSALVNDTFPAALTCSTTCAGTAGGACTAGPFAGNINDAASIPSGGSVIYTSVCAISPSATGTLSNTATVSSGVIPDATAADNSATDTDTLGTSSDLAITKTDGVTTATPGGSVTYTITASNAGPSNATGATVADTFPAALTCTWTCVGAGGGTCTASGSGNINDTVNLPSGASTTYTASCTIAASASGTLSNTATIAAPAGSSDPTPGNNSATDTDTLSGSADLSITKTDGVTTATPGGSVTYTITASNAGPSNATGATIADTFPAALTCSWTCVGAAGGTCTASGSGTISDTVNLPAGGSTTYTASCTISASASGTLSNTATVAAPAGVTDSSPGNNSATDTDTLAGSADLSVTKTDGVTTATPGGSVTYTITASNAGPSNATGATVADTFPASLTCSWTCVGAGGGTCTASGSGNISDTVNLPSGGSTTHTASCTISASATGSISNTATVAAPAGVSDSNTANNSATDTDTLGASADLSITKTDGVTAATPGGSVTYTITASNTGPSDASGATVADTFPAVETCSWTCAGTGGGTCTASGSGNISDTVNLPASGSVTFTAACTIAASATGSVTNTATVTAPAGVSDSNTANNSATDTDTLGAAADLSITKTDGVTSATPGSSVTYTITSSNAGPSDASGATVADTFPAALTCTWTCAGTGGGTCTASGSGNISDTVNLPSGGSTTHTALCTISASASGTLSNTATVEAPASISDSNLANNAATDTDTLGASADLAITKTDGVASIVDGGTLTYTIVASNAGPSDATPASVTDTFPAPLSNCAWTCLAGSGGTCGAASGSGNLADGPNLAVNGSVTYTAVCTVPAGTADGTAIVNNAAISSSAADPATGNNSASDTTTVSVIPPSGASVSGSKTVAGTFVPGSAVTYTIQLSNAGPGPQADNAGDEFTDTLPGGLSLISATASSGTATSAGNVVRWNGAIAAGGSVTITITATLTATTGSIVNQGQFVFDGDGNGSNETSGSTDDPGQPGAADGTGFVVAGAPPSATPVPALDRFGMLLLGLVLLAIGLARRRALE